MLVSFQCAAVVWWARLLGATGYAFTLSTRLDQHRSRVLNSFAPPLPPPTHTHSGNRRDPHTLADANALDDDPSIPYIDTVRRLRSSVFTDGSEDPTSSSSSRGPSFHPIGGAPAASSAASAGTAGSSSSSASAVSPTAGCSTTSSSTGYEDDIAREVNKAEARYNVVERPNDWIKSATRKMAK